MSSAAQRMRLLRQRARAGLVVVQVELDEDDIEALGMAGLLDPMVDHGREDIAGAIKQLLKTIRCGG